MGSEKSQERDHIRNLYMQGVKPKEICKATGLPRETVYNMVARYGWAEQRRSAIEVSANVGAVAPALVDKARAWLKRVQDQGEKRLEELDKRPLPGSARDAKDFIQALKTLDDIGRRSYGLDIDSGPAGVVNIEQLNVAYPTIQAPDPGPKPIEV